MLRAPHAAGHVAPLSAQVTAGMPPVWRTSACTITEAPGARSVWPLTVRSIVTSGNSETQAAHAALATSNGGAGRHLTARARTVALSYALRGARGRAMDGPGGT